MSKKFLVPTGLLHQPTNPLTGTVGDIYYNTVDNLIYSYDGTYWNSQEPFSAVENVLYVSKSGNDSNDGKTLGHSFLTIKAAMAAATAGTTVFVKSGTYTENNPVTIPAKVALVGDSPRNTIIKPANNTQDVFYVNNGCYVEKVGIYDHLSPSAAFAYNPDGSAGAIYASPYILNCSSITTTGKGVYIDGSKVTGGKSMVIGEYTMFNQGGIGVHLTNMAYAQLVSIYTICCDISILTENGAFCSVGTSDTSFGNYGLKADGTSDVLLSGTIDSVDLFNNTVTVSGLSSRPNINGAASFDLGTTFSTISGVTALASGISTITFTDNLPSDIPVMGPVQFYQRSAIYASSHTFEYVGSGTNVATALPQNGGIPVEANEVIQTGGGKVFATSTDQKGNFKIGNDLLFNNIEGTISGFTFDKSLFSIMTPYILAISE